MLWMERIGCFVLMGSWEVFVQSAPGGGCAIQGKGVPLAKIYLVLHAEIGRGRKCLSLDYGELIQWER